MEENTKIELERTNLTNYILQKENKILFETIESLTREKEQLLADLENSKKSVLYRIVRKVINICYRAAKKIKNIGYRVARKIKNICFSVARKIKNIFKKTDKNVSNNEFNEKNNSLTGLEENDSNSSGKKKNKKKIAVVYDVDGWAFNNIAREIKKNLSNDFDIDIFPVSVFDDNPVKLVLLADRYDLVHCLWRGLLSCLDYEYARGYIHNMGLTYEEFMNKHYSKTNITTSVYDHKFLDEENFETTKSFARYAKNYTTSSTLLRDIYKELDIDKKPMAVISDGVDTTKFKPENLERFKLENIQNRKIKIGWVGNSEFTDSEGDSDLKGVRKIIKPALEELIEEGYPIELKFADRKEGYIPHDKMPDYYNSIDVYICGSKNEGTPNPVLESMASGVPVISTNVGIVRDAFGKKQKEFILENRSKEDLKNKLITLLNKKELFEELSKENLTQIQEWTWPKKCEQFKEFFQNNLK